jgi:hypothetical protein
MGWDKAIDSDNKNQDRSTDEHPTDEIAEPMSIAK